MKTYDIQLFRLDNYQWTEDLYDFYESIGWIDPECITGYDKNLVKEHNLQSFGNYDPADGEIDYPDDLIANYCLDIFWINSDIDKFIDFSLWLIIHLADSTPAYIFPAFLREHLQKLNTDDLNQIFDKIYQAIQQYVDKSPYLIVYLLTEFLFESFQYGGEWCIFVDPKNKQGMLDTLMSVQEARETNCDYLCTKLNDDNVTKLASLEQYNIYPISGE